MSKFKVGDVVKLTMNDEPVIGKIVEVTDTYKPYIVEVKFAMKETDIEKV